MDELEVSSAQNGERVALRVGNRVSLSLPENPSTGYRWAIRTIDETYLTVEDTGFRSEGGGVGSGGQAFWRFRARAPGQTRVDLVRWRPWERESSIVERFAFEVDIWP